MPWTYASRTGYQAALHRATRELHRAMEHAHDAGDETAYVDLGGHVLQIQAMRTASIEGARGSQKPSKPIPGQMDIGDAEGTRKAPAGSTGASVRKPRTRRQRA